MPTTVAAAIRRAAAIGITIDVWQRADDRQRRSSRRSRTFGKATVVRRTAVALANAESLRYDPSTRLRVVPSNVEGREAAGADLFHILSVLRN